MSQAVRLRSTWGWKNYLGQATTLMRSLLLGVLFCTLPLLASQQDTPAHPAKTKASKRTATKQSSTRLATSRASSRDEETKTTSAKHTQSARKKETADQAPSPKRRPARQTTIKQEPRQARRPSAAEPETRPEATPSLAAKKEEARSLFDTAERMREELNGMPQKDRTRRDYQRVMDAYRHVYYTAPGSSKADASVVAVAELLAESGRTFSDEKSLRAAISQYEFLRREYPGSKFRFDALFTIGQIYKDDLNEPEAARTAFQEVIRRYPHLQRAADARDALAEMEQSPKKRVRTERSESHPPASSAPAAAAPTTSTSVADSEAATLPLVTGMRHWSTPDYTRVAIDLEQSVKYEAGRVANPDRIFFDLHDTKLASTLVGKSFDVSDGFLKRIRIAQYQRGMVRVVLEVDAVSDYSAFLLPNPYRLIIDIHGRKPNSPQTSLARAQQAEEKRAEDASEEESPHETIVARPAAPNRASAATVATTSPTASVATTANNAPTAESNVMLRPESFRTTVTRDEPTTHNAPTAAEVGPPLADGGFFSNGRAGTRQTSDRQDTWTTSSATDTRSTTAPASRAASRHTTTKSTSARQESTKDELANLNGPTQKATGEPTSAPLAEVVAPRRTATSRRNLREREAERREAQPTTDGRRSLIRALGLKVGRIVVDAGHGGHDTGTIGPNGLLEKDLVLDVALRLGRLLQTKLGAEVIYTRDDDTFIPLETRTAIANKHQADLFISVHANSSQDPSARGVETYYLNFNPSPDALEVAARENAVSEKSVHELSDLVKKITLKEKVDESREFATDVEHALYQGLAGQDAHSPIKDRGVKKAPFIVLIGANMPSILTEISFVSNPQDERKLQTPEYRQRIAESLYRGVKRYIDGLSGIKVAGRNGGEAAQ